MKSSKLIDELRGEIPVRINQNTLETMRSRRKAGGGSASSTVEGDASVFSVRYGFRPDSMDPNAPSSLSRDEEGYLIETPNSSNEGDPFLFRGQSTNAKNLDYVLAYDPRSQTMELLPLDSTLRVNKSREKPKRSNNGLLMPSGSGSGRGSKSVSPAISNSPHSRSISPPDDREYTATSAPKVASKSLPKSSATAASSSNSSSKSASPAPPVVVEASKKAPATAVTKKKAAANTTASKPASASAASAASAAGVKKRKSPVKKSTTAGKAPPKSSSAGASAAKAKAKATEPPAAASAAPPNNDDDDDDDLLGALANELEDALEDDTDQKPQAPQQPMEEESEESDEDEEDTANNVVMIEPKQSQQPQQTAQKQFSSGNDDGPISLRGYVTGRREEEDDLSSSEEE